MSIYDARYYYADSGRQLVVDNWSAEFAAGSVTAITGPSGCGKSTRLYLLALMLKLRSGQIQLAGDRVDNLGDAAKARLRAQRFGFVFQDAALDPTRTVADNIIETCLYSRGIRSEYLSRAHHLMDKFGISVPAHRKPGQISGGQAQRIALCRALVAQPEVVFADEPTGNLDPQSARTVLNAFAEHAAQGGCVIIVTHDPAIARWADEHIALPAPSAVSAAVTEPDSSLTWCPPRPDERVGG